VPRALPIAVPVGALAALALTVSAAHPEAQRAESVQRGLLILARIPNIFGPGKSAEMAYYRKGRAKVFAAGSLNFGGSAELRIPAQMLDNLWEKLSRP
jgi:hypothetical protein